MIFDPAFLPSISKKVKADSNGIWVAKVSPTCNTLRAIKGRSERDIYAVGDNATIIHYNEFGWQIDLTSDDIKNLGIDPNTTFYSIGWQTDPSELWKQGDNMVMVVGDKATLIKLPGQSWKVSKNAPQKLYAATFLSNSSNIEPVRSPSTEDEYYGWFAGGESRIAVDKQGQNYNASISFLQKQNMNLDNGWNNFFHFDYLSDQDYNSKDWTRIFTEVNPANVIYSLSALNLDGYYHAALAAGGNSNSAVFYVMNTGVYGGKPEQWRQIYGTNDPAIKSIDTELRGTPLPYGESIATGGDSNSFQIYFVPNSQTGNYERSNQPKKFSDSIQNPNNNFLNNPTAITFGYNYSDGNQQPLDDGTFWVVTANGYIVSVKADFSQYWNPKFISATPKYTPTDSNHAWYGVWADPKPIPQATSKAWAVGNNGHIMHLVPNGIIGDQENTSCPSPTRKLEVDVWWDERGVTKHAYATELIRDLTPKP